jgi:hypothetical protein
MEITIQEIEDLRVPDAFTPVVGYRRFGIPWPPRKENAYLTSCKRVTSGLPTLLP